MSGDAMTKNHNGVGGGFESRPPVTPDVIQTCKRIGHINHFITLCTLAQIEKNGTEQDRSANSIRTSNQDVIGEDRERSDTYHSLDRLLDAGVVERYKAPQDKSSGYYYQLTEWGKTVVCALGLDAIGDRFQFDGQANTRVEKPDYLNESESIWNDN